MRSFFIGLQFLTRIFVVHQDNWTEEDFGRSVRWFALIGAVLGCIYAATAYVATLFLPEHGVVLAASSGNGLYC
jgi:adenosylcobinamide-GDP ribazoletransferase